MASSTELADRILIALEGRNPRFHPDAYLFTLQALDATIARLEVPRHLDGPEVANGVVAYAVERYGLMARTVLEFWGIANPDDIGEVVFAMVEHGVLLKKPGEELGDFEGALDFDEVFDEDRYWAQDHA